MKPFRSLTNYFQGVVAEMRKVVWPTLPTVVRYFSSVVVGVALATVFIGAIDYVFIHSLGLIIK